MEDADIMDLSVLANSEDFRAFAHIMANLTGLAVALYKPDGSRLHAYTLTPNRNPLCAMIRNCREGLDCCHRDERARFAEVVMSRGPICRQCHAGFVDLAIPIVYGDGVIAIISSGQLLPTPHSEEGLQAFMPLCTQFGIDREALRKGYDGCIYLGKVKTEAAIQLLTFFSRHICTVTERPPGDETDGSAAVITKARRYIREHLAEELSLLRVAEHIQRSPGYLSRQFERVAGCTFTVYVQQARVDRVQHLLLHSALPITEIAMMSGFSSISQFNRSFHKHSGCTPRTFRARYQ